LRLSALASRICSWVSIASVSVGYACVRSSETGRRLKKFSSCRGDLELMAVVALGHPAEVKGEGTRKPVDEVILHRR
jgi:hypothetical protein